jgi:TPP-dependent trihydroxycyclohexane-1,2-dione (THcHDO) dehydratase
MLAFATYQLKSFMGDASFIVKQSELVTAVVEQSRFQVNVRATGVLKPVYIRWISA